MKALLGGKGANLAEMTRIGLPVPPGFTITTEVCTWSNAHGKTLPKELDGQVEEAVSRIEKILGRGFGDASNPLLFAVRSGARDSMPGMMDTILNLGLNDHTVQGLIATSRNERFAYDCYRRFVQMYGDVVMGVQRRKDEHHDPFEAAIDQLKEELFHGRTDVADTELDAEALKELTARFKALVKERAGHPFPDDPRDQLRGAIIAVFASWGNERAVVYRQKYNIPSEWGTAVNVQAMVFGNTGDTSSSGVAFTRDPATGEKVFYGEYLINAQGEDVVAGVRTPDPVATMQEKMPQAYRELEDVRASLEKHFREMQDFEFTVQEGKLFMLQTRNGKRTGIAAVRIACEMVKEKLITWREAVERVPADQLSQLLAPIFDRKALGHAKKIASGLAAGPGAATGRICFNAIDAETEAKHGPVLLVRNETSPEDIRGMLAAEGILTVRGGVSSHAALVARQMGKVCVCGAKPMVIDYHEGTLTVADQVFRKGDFLSIDGSTGEVYAGEVKTAPSEIVSGAYRQVARPEVEPHLRQLRAADDLGRQGPPPADPHQRRPARPGGERGGLRRAGHRPLPHGAHVLRGRPDRRRARDDPRRRDQRPRGRPGEAPPLPAGRLRGDLPRARRPARHHPPARSAAARVPAPHRGAAKGTGRKARRQRGESRPARQRAARVQPPCSAIAAAGSASSIRKSPPCRPRAIFEAALDVQRDGIKVRPEIMIPLVGFPRELELQTALVRDVAAKVMAEKGWQGRLPRRHDDRNPRAPAVVADEIAKTAEFFSFGTNDLTQTTLGMSRDDSGSFLPSYQNSEILKANPFESVDRTGVGALMKMAIERGRRTRPEIKLGICGEHGGDPASIHFCHEAGLTYVSCSPYRVPVARLAAAQAALADGAKK